MGNGWEGVIIIFSGYFSLNPVDGGNATLPQLPLQIEKKKKKNPEFTLL